jgi:hypothetical protein
MVLAAHEFGIGEVHNARTHCCTELILHSTGEVSSNCYTTHSPLADIIVCIWDGPHINQLSTSFISPPLKRRTPCVGVIFQKRTLDPQTDTHPHLGPTSPSGPCHRAGRPPNPIRTRARHRHLRESSIPLTFRRRLTPFAKKKKHRASVGPLSNLPKFEHFQKDGDLGLACFECSDLAICWASRDDQWETSDSEMARSTMEEHGIFDGMNVSLAFLLGGLMRVE